FHLVGQWFPKIGVYEPAGMRGRASGGGNCHPFHPNPEFYADYGSYDVTVTVPSRHLGGATGKNRSPTRKDGRRTRPPEPTPGRPRLRLDGRSPLSGPRVPIRASGGHPARLERSRRLGALDAGGRDRPEARAGPAPPLSRARRLAGPLRPLDEGSAVLLRAL